MPPLNARYDLSGILPLFSYLHDIDDALHLARTCRAIYAVFDDDYTRAYIFRSIIRNAPHHEHDAQLTGVQILRDTFSWGRIPAEAYHLRHNFLAGFHFDLDAENIFAIVCRWHALRALFTLYCDRTIHRAYTRPWVPFWDQDSLVKETYLADEGPLRRCPASSSGSAHLKVSRISGDRRRRAYHRFYKAIVSHWCALEHFYLSRVFEYPNDLERNAFTNLTLMKWRYNPSRGLAEKLDLIEVVDFIWEFLPRKVFDSESTDACNPDDPTYLVERMYLLRPPQIIQFVDLALRVAPRPLPNRFALFDDLLAEYHRFDRVGQRGLGAESFSLMDLEDEVANYVWRACTPRKELRFVPPELDVLTAWYRYRAEAWWWDARGLILFRSEGARMLVRRLLDVHD